MSGNGNSGAAMAKTDQSSALIERVIVAGDLADLSPAERVSYYMKVCDSAGLNPLTKPFEYIRLNGRMTLYALKAATDQIRSIRKISIKIVSREVVEDVYVVTAQATEPSGRCDESTGAVAIAGLKGENRANAYMKAETKAKRRVTLSIAGLGLLDESEIDSIPNAMPVAVSDRGEILGAQSMTKNLADVLRTIQTARNEQALASVGEAASQLSVAEKKVAKEAFKKKAAELGMQPGKKTAGQATQAKRAELPPEDPEYDPRQWDGVGGPPLTDEQGGG